MSEEQLTYCTCTYQDVGIGCPIHDGPTTHYEGAQPAQSEEAVCECGHGRSWHTSFEYRMICVKRGCLCADFAYASNPNVSGAVVHHEAQQRAQSTAPVSHTTSALDEAADVANLAIVYPDLMPETRAALAELVRVSRRLNEAITRLVQGLEGNDGI